MLSFPTKLHIFILFPQYGRTFWRYLQNLFSNQRPTLVICFSSRNFIQGNIHGFFLFFFSVERLGKYIPFLKKKKKKSHLGEGGEGRLGGLTISPRSILVILSLFLFGFKIL